jgi:hypothetical protein
MGKEAFRTRNRSVRRVAQKLHRIARRKGEKAKEDLKEAYRKLITITQASCAQARRVLKVLEGALPTILPEPGGCWRALSTSCLW